MARRLPDNHNRSRTPHGADHPRRPARTGKQSENLQCCFYMVDPSGTRRRRHKLQQSGSGSGGYHGEIRSPAQIGYTAFWSIDRRYERTSIQPIGIGRQSSDQIIRKVQQNRSYRGG